MMYKKERCVGADKEKAPSGLCQRSFLIGLEKT